MQIHDGPDAARGLSPMQMTMFGTLNGCTLGVFGFPKGPAPWELHPDDELLYLVSGEMDLTVLGDGEATHVTLRPGGLCIMPRAVWHRPEGRVAGTVLFAVSKTEHSEADPRG